MWGWRMMWVHRCACVVLLVGFHVHRFWRGVLEPGGKQFLDWYSYFIWHNLGRNAFTIVEVIIFHVFAYVMSLGRQIGSSQ
jgi:hypothetical protein